MPTAGKNIVVCGRSQRVGMPIATLACLEDTGKLLVSRKLVSDVI